MHVYIYDKMNNYSYFYLATSGLSTGALVGIVVGIGGTTVLVFIVLVVLVLLVVILKRKRNTKSKK